MRLEEVRNKLWRAMAWTEKAMLTTAKYDAYLSVGMAVLVLFWANDAHATQATISIQTVYTTVRAAVKGLWGALFTLLACAAGMLEFFMGGKNMGHLLTFVGVAFAPHIACAIVDFFFNTGDAGTQQ